MIFWDQKHLDKSSAFSCRKKLIPSLYDKPLFSENAAESDCSFSSWKAMVLFTVLMILNVWHLSHLFLQTGVIFASSFSYKPNQNFKDTSGRWLFRCWSCWTISNRGILFNSTQRNAFTRAKIFPENEIVIVRLPNKSCDLISLLRLMTPTELPTQCLESPCKSSTFGRPLIAW